MFTLLPWTSRIEAVLDAQFPRGVELKVTVDALLRGTTKDRYEAHKLAIEAGWKLPEEVRATEDLPPIETVPTPGGDDMTESTALAFAIDWRAPVSTDERTIGGLAVPWNETSDADPQPRG